MRRVIEPANPITAGVETIPDVMVSNANPITARVETMSALTVDVICSKTHQSGA